VRPLDAPRRVRRGDDATLVGDAHTNLYWSNQAAPGRMAGTVETKEVDFGGPS